MKWVTALSLLRLHKEPLIETVSLFPLDDRDNLFLFFHVRTVGGYPSYRILATSAFACEGDFIWTMWEDSKERAFDFLVSSLFLELNEIEQALGLETTKR